MCNYAAWTGYSSSTIGEWSTSYYLSLSNADKLSSIALSGPCYPVFVAYSPLVRIPHSLRSAFAIAHTRLDEAMVIPSALTVYVIHVTTD